MSKQQNGNPEVTSSNPAGKPPHKWLRPRQKWQLWVLFHKPEFKKTVHTFVSVFEYQPNLD